MGREVETGGKEGRDLSYLCPELNPFASDLTMIEPARASGTVRLSRLWSRLEGLAWTRVGAKQRRRRREKLVFGMMLERGDEKEERAWSLWVGGRELGREVGRRMLLQVSELPLLKLSSGKRSAGEGGREEGGESKEMRLDIAVHRRVEREERRRGRDESGWGWRKVKRMGRVERERE